MHCAHVGESPGESSKTGNLRGRVVIAMAGQVRDYPTAKDIKEGEVREDEVTSEAQDALNILEEGSVTAIKPGSDDLEMATGGDVEVHGGSSVEGS